MTEVKPDVPPAKWQTVVTTIHCDLIDEYVSIMVQKDWTSMCTWYKQNKMEDPESRRGFKSGKRSKVQLQRCQGPYCSYVTGYRDKLIEEEREAASKSA